MRFLSPINHQFDASICVVFFCFDSVLKFCRQSLTDSNIICVFFFVRLCPSTGTDLLEYLVRLRPYALRARVAINRIFQMCTCAPLSTLDHIVQNDPCLLGGYDTRSRAGGTRGGERGGPTAIFVRTVVLHRRAGSVACSASCKLAPPFHFHHTIWALCRFVSYWYFVVSCGTKGSFFFFFFYSKNLSRSEP